MNDPRINPNYRGEKCKGCGEYLPFLFNRLCTPCALEAKDAEIERQWKQIERLHKQVAERDVEVGRLRKLAGRIHGLVRSDPQEARRLLFKINRALDTVDSDKPKPKMYNTCDKQLFKAVDEKGETDA